MCIESDQLFYLFSPSVLPRTVRCVTMLAYVCVYCECVEIVCNFFVVVSAPPKLHTLLNATHKMRFASFSVFVRIGINCVSVFA